MPNKFSVLVLFFTLVGCLQSNVNKILSPNLEVQFDKAITLKQAKAFTKFWQENGFVGKKQQVIKIQKEKSNFLICLIPTQTEKKHVLTFEEKLAIKPLQSGLANTVFGGVDVYLAYTDDHFQNPILILP